ncbi:MAG: (deoxy)nucleoside triphosphate pyrophosphohydrolase [Planctomycetaceae bacterium]|nr:(deoxy)nucleoside triphosphate pyrophosphohydrolase [Planctomycetaceae bacterium]
MSLKRQRIGIAVVEHDGRYLVGVRGENGPLPGFSEFPGGKCLDGESPEHGAARECAEETGLAVEIVDALYQRDFDYPHARVALHFYLCRPRGPVAERHQDFHWVSATALRDLKFPPANQPVVELLVNRALREVRDADGMGEPGR